jgi:hypothetical protein
MVVVTATATRFTTSSWSSALSERAMTKKELWCVGDDDAVMSDDLKASDKTCLILPMIRRGSSQGGIWRRR